MFLSISLATSLRLAEVFFENSSSSLAEIAGLSTIIVAGLIAASLLVFSGNDRVVEGLLTAAQAFDPKKLNPELKITRITNAWN